MSFDFSTLITDRTRADVSRVQELASKIRSGTASESELVEFNSAAMKGAYNHTDLNRVTAAMESLKAKLEGYGYDVPGYQRIKVPRDPPHVPSASRLPKGYLELTYIESTGTQYIDTGFTYGASNVGSRIVSDSIVGEAVTDTYALSGVGAKPCFYYGVRQYSATDRRLMYGKGNADGTTTVQYNNKRCVFDLDLQNQTYTVKDVESGSYLLNVSDIAVSTPTKTTPVTLFGRWRANSNDVSYIKERIYSCKIYDNGALVRNFVSCINPNGEVGLYDLVTSAFFGNSGTGAFVPGARVEITLPEEYTQVEYIESTGTQYINTGISVPHASCKIAVKFKTRNILDRPPIAGCAYTTWNWSVNMMFPYQNAFYANGGSTGIAFAANTLYNAEYTKTYVTVNGQTVQKSIANTVDGYNNTIFYGSTRYGAHLLYEYRLYDGETLVRDMIPVIRKQDEEAGLYDLVNGVFYGNAGTGTFTTGGIIQAPSTDSDPYTWYEFDWPTPETVTVYLLNVVALRSVFAVMASTPSVPPDMVGLMAEEANNIEKILVDINELLIKSTQVWFYSDELFAGEV